MTLSRILLILVLAFSSLGLEYIGAGEDAQDTRAVLVIGHSGSDTCDPSIADAEAPTPAEAADRPGPYATGTPVATASDFSSRPLSPPLKPPRTA